MEWFNKLKARLQALFEAYGKVAIAVWFGLFALTLSSFALAFQMGVEVEGVAGNTGIWGAAYVATQLTKPLRIAATLILTPFVAKLFGRTPQSALTE